MNLLALDTGTQTLSIAVSRTVDGRLRTWQTHAEGGAQASTGLIAAILDLLQQAELRLDALDAICFGAGPGSFTGLRTACSVTQGLAFGAKVPVLAMNSLLAVAEEARYAALADQPQGVLTALLDARMNEMYVASFAFEDGRWSDLPTHSAPRLVRPENLVDYLASLQPPESGPLVHGAAGSPWLLAGNVFTEYAERLHDVDRCGTATRIAALPTAAAMLRLAPPMLQAGQAVAAEFALPIYVRDKVAQTTAERMNPQAANRPQPRS
ncbi:MAG: tRNA (adenosine(37)-N6)-threonylcarbamoyltransferase complex dimerization subunit type 1 TsaB [Rhodoferax sp.]|nr:tRNA (adenosine(37)-N6)-threonylcarbamoyltransferase complex dimerization subunit type 1 TsaB [Rhodoferax sp.]